MESKEDIDCKKQRLIFRLCSEFSEEHDLYCSINSDFVYKFLTSAFDSVILSETYIKEWIGRFASGCPYAYMDNTRRRAYLSLMEMY